MSKKNILKNTKNISNDKINEMYYLSHGFRNNDFEKIKKGLNIENSTKKGFPVLKIKYIHS